MLQAAIERGREKLFGLVTPTGYELERRLPGDSIVTDPAVVLDRTMVLSASPEEIFLWLAQIGKRSNCRAGYYLCRKVERFFPKRNRALRYIDPTITLREGDVIKDWADVGKLKRKLHRLTGFGKPSEEPTATAHTVTPGKTIVFVGKRGETEWSWALQLDQTDDGRTKLHMRMRITSLPKWMPLGLSDALDLLWTEFFRQGMEERLAGK